MRRKLRCRRDDNEGENLQQDIAGKELPGRKPQSLDQDGKVVVKADQYRESTLHRNALIGKYTLREETAPDGYLVAKDVEFEVKDTIV